MSQLLSDLFANRFESEPPEILAIKTYIQDNFEESVSISIRDDQIIIMTRSSALAGALRPHLYKMSKLTESKRRLLIRVG